MSALEAARPVMASVLDLDLRATTLEQLRGLLPEHGPRWHFSTACILQADSTEVIYHFERTHLPNQLVAAAYCTEDKPADWSQEIVPGVAWTQQVRSVPAAVLRRPRP